MQNTPCKTSRPALRRLADALLPRLLQKLPGAMLAAGRAAGWCLLLGASLTSLHAQVDSDPNDMVGTIEWNNSAGPVRDFLLQSLNHPPAAIHPGGFGVFNMTATPTIPGFSVNSGNVYGTGDGASTPYGLRVQGVDASVPPVPGVVYRVQVTASTPDGATYVFAPQNSPTVFPASAPHNAPPVTLNFSECAGLIRVLYRDTAGLPVTPSSSGAVLAYLQSTGELQASQLNIYASEYYLPVRGGNTFNLVVGLRWPGGYCGTDRFVDFIEYPSPQATTTTNFTITVGCNEMVTVTLIVVVPPPFICPGSNGSTPSKIIGRVDMLGPHYENWMDQVSTLMTAANGPFANLGNIRYDSVEPACFPGCVSPLVGTPTDNSAGSFSLLNLLPSDTVTPPAVYNVSGTMNYGSGRRYQYFATPHIQVHVPPSTCVDLTNTFEMNPGYRIGDVFLCGPEEKPGIPSSPLRYIIRDSDNGLVNPNGIPNSLDLRTSYVAAGGQNELAPGATLTAAGGLARAIFEGQFEPGQNAFVGDYRLTLGGLLSQPTVWRSGFLFLRFNNVTTPGTPESYFSCSANIGNRHYSHETVNPGETIINAQRYGFSCVRINFHAKNGTLYLPGVNFTGRFETAPNGVPKNFEGQPADYDVDGGGSGTPLDFPGAVDGLVNLALPEGQYTFNPVARVVSPDETIVSDNALPPFSLLVGPCQKITICSELQMSLSSLPMCATNRVQQVTGSLNSVADVVSISYVLNGAAPVPVPISASFAFDITLADCVNTLTVTATTADTNCFASVQTTSAYDRIAPVLTGCQNISTNSIPGTNGNFVTYSVTALDNCEGSLPVTCVPPSGSFFPAGATVVTCTAVDHCRNTNTCQFTVTVKLECVAILDERFTASGTNGVDSYRFCVRNQSDHDLGYVTLVDLSPGVSATPYFIPLTPPVAPGETACVTVALSGVGARTNLCFRLMAHSPDFMQCCIISHCVSLAASDLYVEDTPVNYVGTPDLGGEPDANMIGQPMWVSRGIWVHQDCTQPPGTHLTHQNPRYGQQNCVFAEVKNRGTAPVAGAKLEIYFANASLGLSWPAEWTLLGTVTLPTIAAGASHVAQSSWLPPGTGHYCLIARIVSAVDPMTTPEGTDINANVRANNNLAWRNVNVAECLHTPANKVEVRVHNTEPVPKLLTLIFTADQDFLANGGEAILSPGTPLFDRWVAAGAHGVNVVVTNGNEIRFTGSPARFEGIPFSENEERIFNLTLRADEPMPVPGTNHVYHASLMQAIDGQIVGGVNYVIVTRALDTDTDGDGIPDVNDPDDDGDGIPDALDPKPTGESDCPPSALSINLLGGQVALTWSGLGYRLQASTDFSHWDELPAATSPATLPAGSPYRFFRLICR